MKTKILILLGLVATVTLSFTFSASKNVDKKSMLNTHKIVKSEPLGGFISEDKL